MTADTRATTEVVFGGLVGAATVDACPGTRIVVVAAEERQPVGLVVDERLGTVVQPTAALCPDPVLADAVRHVVDRLGPGWIDWVTAADGLQVARVADHDGVVATMVFTDGRDASASAQTVQDTVESWTRVPCLAFGFGDELVPAGGRATAHRVLSALESMPPAGTVLALQQVVESGAPLAIWAPVPATTSADYAWENGTGDGRAWTVRLPGGAEISGASSYDMTGWSDPAAVTVVMRSEEA